MLVISKGCCGRETLPQTFDIGVFKSGKTNSSAIKPIDNESTNLIDSCDIAFDTIDWWNFP